MKQALALSIILIGILTTFSLYSITEIGRLQNDRWELLHQKNNYMDLLDRCEMKLITNTIIN